MAVSGITNNSSNSSAAASTSSKLKLQASDFIKMMITQLQNQDPLEPAKNQELLAQMSNISQLQSSTDLTGALKTITLQNGISNAASMIGKMVTGKDSNGEDMDGIVSSVKVEDGSLYLELDSGKKMSLANVTNIAAASTVGTTKS